MHTPARCAGPGKVALPLSMGKRCDASTPPPGHREALITEPPHPKPDAADVGP
jgi:hypothetical protein